MLPKTENTRELNIFQNGLCECNHATVDNMLRKMTEQHADTPIEVLLSWVNMAKTASR